MSLPPAPGVDKVDGMARCFLTWSDPIERCPLLGPNMISSVRGESPACVPVLRLHAMLACRVCAGPSQAWQDIGLGHDETVIQDDHPEFDSYQYAR